MRVPTTFGKRALIHQQERQIKMRYFLAFEGEKTEYQYFAGIIKYQEYLKINPVIEIIPLSRHLHQKGLSHPKNICKQMEEEMKMLHTGELTLKSLVDHLSDWVLKNSSKPRTQRENLSRKLLRDLGKKHGHIPETIVSGSKDLVVQQICDLLDTYEAIEVSPETISAFHQYLKQQKQYNKRDGDKACIIIDRDSGSFTAAQYNDVLTHCKKSNLDLFVTNPRFEFWLLLHFLQKQEIDVDKICASPEPGKEPYLENLLHQHYPSFSKHHVPFDPLKDKITVAMENEKSFCEDIEQLKDHIGCNIGLLLSELMQNNES